MTPNSREKNDLAETSVSVVIPTFNGGRHIAECLQSVLSQDVDTLEVFISDGGSTDDTVEVARAIGDARVTIVESRERIPVEVNWTRACQFASGSFTKLLCQDDVLVQGALERQVRMLSAYRSAVATVGPRKIIDDDGRVVMSRRGTRGLSAVQSGREALRKTMISGGNILGEPSAVLFRTDALASCLPWSVRFPYLLDLELYARVLQLGDLTCSADVVASFRVHRGSWSVDLGSRQVEDFNRWADWLMSAGMIDVRRGDRTRTRITAKSSAIARRAVYRARL